MLTPTFVKDIKIEVNYSGVNALTMDLSHLEMKIKSPVYGLMGYDFFKDLNVYLNYEERKLGLWSHTEVEKYMSSNEYESYDFKLEKHLPIIECEIDGTVYNFALDTGANTNLINLKFKERLQEVVEAKEKPKSITGANQGPEKADHSLYKLKSFEIVNLGQYSNMDVVFSDIDHLNHNDKIIIDGILGYGFLSQYSHIISYTDSRLYRMKN